MDGKWWVCLDGTELPHTGNGAVATVDGNGIPEWFSTVVQQSLDQAEEIGRLKAEHAYLRAMLEDDEPEARPRGFLQRLWGARGVISRRHKEQVMAEYSQIVARAVSRVTATQKASASGTPPLVDHRPKLEDFLRIVPVGQTRADGAVTFTLLALEVYADGCGITYQVIDRDAGDGTVRFPQIAIEATDDAGGKYTGWTMGCGGGSGDPGTFRWRGAQSLAPTLDPAAREVTLAVSLAWQPADAPLHTRLPLDPVTAGDAPWFFVVPIG